jgi:hypothetical protein
LRALRKHGDATCFARTFEQRLLIPLGSGGEAGEVVAEFQIGEQIASIFVEMQETLRPAIKTAKGPFFEPRQLSQLGKQRGYWLEVLRASVTH